MILKDLILQHQGFTVLVLKDGVKPFLGGHIVPKNLESICPRPKKVGRAFGIHAVQSLGISTTSLKILLKTSIMKKVLYSGGRGGLERLLKSENA